MRYRDVGTAVGSVEGVDLVVEVVAGEYKPQDRNKNGLETSWGTYGQINFKGNPSFQPTLRFSFMKAGTNTLHNIASFKWTFLDMDVRCASSSQSGCRNNYNNGAGSTAEQIRISNTEFSEFYLHNGNANGLKTYNPGQQSSSYSDIDMSVSGGVTSWTGTIGERTNPSNPDTLDGNQKRVTLGLKFENKASFEATFEVQGPNNFGRNIFFTTNSGVVTDSCA